MTSFKGFIIALSLLVMSVTHQSLLSASNDVPGKITATLQGFIPFGSGDCTFRIIIVGPGNRRIVSENITYSSDMGGPNSSQQMVTFKEPIQIGVFPPTQKGNYGDYFVYGELVELNDSSFFMPIILIEDSRDGIDDFALMPPVVLAADPTNTQSPNYLLYLGSFSVR